MESIGRLLKYFQERGGPDHGGTLHWPGTPAGFPVRSEQQLLLKQHETEELEHTFDYHSQLFRLWEPEDKAAFDQIMDRIANGWYGIRRRIDKDVPDQLAPAVWLEWIQIYGETPQGRQPGGHFDAHGQATQVGRAQ